MKLEQIKKLHLKKYRQEFGVFLVEGEHLILELQAAITHLPELAQAQLLVTEAYRDWPTPLNKTEISVKQMAQIADTKTPQGILAVVAMSALQPLNQHKHIQKSVYLHEIQDPGNLGTIMRSLAWFGDLKCLLSPNSVDPYNPKVVRASMGAIFHIPIEQNVSQDDIAQRFSKLAYLDMNGRAISDPSFNDFDCYVFGNEARGVPQELLALTNNTAFTIPGSGAIESLNLATAVSLSLYELRGRR